MRAACHASQEEHAWADATCAYFGQSAAFNFIHLCAARLEKQITLHGMLKLSDDESIKCGNRTASEADQARLAELGEEQQPRTDLADSSRLQANQRQGRAGHQGLSRGRRVDTQAHAWPRRAVRMPDARPQDSARQPSARAAFREREQMSPCQPEEGDENGA
eukprot:6195310-Pleurochrysis_carterae.AAC.4